MSTMAEVTEATSTLCSALNNAPDDVVMKDPDHNPDHKFPETEPDSDDESIPEVASPTNSDSENTSNDDPALPTFTPEHLEAKLATAIGLKEQGNALFAQGENTYDKAIRAYRSGINTLKPFNLSNSGDEQTKVLLVSLQNNMAMVLGKQKKWKNVKEITSSALKIDETNVKSYFRRAVANKEMKDFTSASNDLIKGLSYDPANKDLKREQLVLQKIITL